jgi:hypothetical protein
MAPAIRPAEATQGYWIALRWTIIVVCCRPITNLATTLLNALGRGGLIAQRGTLPISTTVVTNNYRRWADVGSYLISEIVVIHGTAFWLLHR